MIFTLWRWSSLTWHILLLCPQRCLWAGCLPLQTGRQPKRYRILCLWHLHKSRKFQTFQSHKKTVGEQNKKADKRRRCMAVTCSSFKIPKLCENSQLRCEQVWCHLHPFKFAPLKRRDLQTKVCCTLGRWCTVQSFKGWCNVSLYRYYMKASQ